MAETSDVVCSDETADYCDHCYRKGDGCTCWMLDPVYTGEATI